MAGLYNITIEQGATFTETYTWKDGSGNLVNLSGYTAKMQIRDHAGNILLDLANVAGGLSINAAAGSVTVTIDATTTGAITWRSGVYDLKLSSASYTKRLLEGEVSVSPQETA